MTWSTLVFREHGKIPAEMVREMILDPGQVVSYHNYILLNAKLPQPDCLLAEYHVVFSPLPVHIIHYDGIVGKYVNH